MRNLIAAVAALLTLAGPAWAQSQTIAWTGTVPSGEDTILSCWDTGRCAMTYGRGDDYLVVSGPYRDYGDTAFCFDVDRGEAYFADELDPEGSAQVMGAFAGKSFCFEYAADYSYVRSPRGVVLTRDPEVERLLEEHAVGFRGWGQRG